MSFQKLSPTTLENLLDKYGVSGLFTKIKNNSKIVTASKRKFQVALDVDLKTTKRILRNNKEALHCFDYIEVGTPLIKESGIKAVKDIDLLLKKLGWKGKVFADMKIADVGKIESDMAFRYADMTSVLANTSNKTIGAVLKNAKQKNKEF